MSATVQLPLTAPPRTKPILTPGPIRFGHKGWIAIRGEEKIDPRRVRRAAAVAVERTPLFRVVGEPEPIDLTEIVDRDDDPLSEYERQYRIGCWTLADQIAEFGQIVDHDPVRYAPYSDLVCDGDPGWSTTYYLLEIV